MKICCRCRAKKKLVEFNRSSRYKDGRQPACRQCSKDYYRQNATRHKANVKQARERHRQRVVASVMEYLREHPCVDCGEDNPVVLEFDHVRGEKKLSISVMICNGHSWPMIMEEIAKCEVRCANCHRIRTAAAGSWYRH